MHANNLLLFLCVLLAAGTAMSYPAGRGQEQQARAPKPDVKNEPQSAADQPRLPDATAVIKAGVVSISGMLGLTGSVLWLHQKSGELKQCLDPVGCFTL